MTRQDKWSNSRALLRRSRQALSGGVSSPFRAKAPVPLYFEDGRGCRLCDVDGNVYIDYALGWGPNILGYRHPAIVRALSDAASGPHTYGAQHKLEYVVAEKIQSLVPCAARVAFTSSGSEAVQLATRLARAHSGRNLIVKFEGHYHGWMDSMLFSYHAPITAIGPDSAPLPAPGSRGQVPNAAENVLTVRWNHPLMLEDLLRARSGEIAAVIMEPVLCNSGCILPDEGYLGAVRELCTRSGVLLIFDEVITGFRIAIGGAQSVYGVTPDVATFGKAVGGGLTLSVITGRADIMDQMSEGVSFGGTFNGNPISLAGASATLDELSRDGGAALAQANRSGTALMEGIRALAAKARIPLLVSGFGAAFALHFTTRTKQREYRDVVDDDGARLTKFVGLALEEGLWLLPDGRWYVSAVHGPDDVAETLAALERVFWKLV